MFYGEDKFEEMTETVVLVNFTPGYKLGDFNCGIRDYNEFLTNDAPIYISENISQVKLLLNKQTAVVFGIRICRAIKRTWCGLQVHSC